LPCPLLGSRRPPTYFPAPANPPPLIIPENFTLPYRQPNPLGISSLPPLRLIFAGRQRHEDPLAKGGIFGPVEEPAILGHSGCNKRSKSNSSGFDKNQTVAFYVKRRYSPDLWYNSSTLASADIVKRRRTKNVYQRK
jgi:hypothetical protein